MGQTIIEKIISNHAENNVYANDLNVASVDFVMATDTTTPLTVRAFEEMEAKSLFDPTKMAIVIDHASPASNERVAKLHVFIRAYAKEHRVTIYDVGEG